MSVSAGGSASTSKVISTASSLTRVRSLQSVSRAIPWISAGTGILALTGWWLHVDALTKILPGLATMKPITGLAFVFAGTALWLRRVGIEERRGAILAGKSLAVGVVLIGLTTLAEYLFGLDLGIDNVLFRGALTATGVVHPGRMAPTTALAFAILGSALLFIDYEFRNKIRPAEWLALFACLMGFVATLGYVYGAEALYRVSIYSSMALHTAILFVLLSLAILFARPGRGIVAVLTSEYLGGSATRRLLPLVILVPIVVGWFRLQGQRRGWYGTEFGLALFACLNIVLLVAIVWINGLWLDRTDLERRQNHENLKRILDSIFTFVGLFSTDGILLDANRAPLEMGGLKREDVIGQPLAATYWFSHSIAAQDRVRVALARAARGDIVRYDEVIRAAGDGRITIDLTLNPVRDHTGKVVQIVGSAVDITLRKQSEAALSLSEERLQLAAEGSNTGLWDWDLLTNDVYFSPTWKRQIGYEDEEVPNRFEEWESRVHPDDLREAQAKLKAYIEKPWLNFENEFRFRHKDGSYRWILAQASMQMNEQGKPVRMLGSHIDITERKQKEEALRESEARVRSIFEQASDGIYVISVDHRYLDVNERGRELLGYSRDELLRMSVADVLAPHEVARLAVEPPRMMAGVPHAAEWDHVRSDGTMFPGEVSATRLNDHSYLAIVRDLTERRRAEAALRESEAKFSTAFFNSSVALAIATLDGKMVEVNEAFCGLVGYKREEIMGKTSPEIGFMTADARAKMVQAIDNAGGSLKNAELAFRAKDGSLHEIVQSIAPISLGGVPHRLATMVDVTERNRAERELRTQADQLRALSTRLQTTREEERIKIARELHDQIGQAFTALKMDVTWLAKRIPTDQAEVQQRVRSALALVGDGVQWVRKTCTELRPGVLDDLGLAAAIEWQAKEFSARTGIRIDVAVPAENMALDDAQSTAIFRIFQEALTNIARHASARSVTTSLLQDDGQVKLVVQDDGKGIREADMKQSLGVLGMRERAQACGGLVQIVGKPGQGTQVLVSIPFRKK